MSNNKSKIDKVIEIADEAVKTAKVVKKSASKLYELLKKELIEDESK